MNSKLLFHFCLCLLMANCNPPPVKLITEVVEKSTLHIELLNGDTDLAQFLQKTPYVYPEISSQSFESLTIEDNRILKFYDVPLEAIQINLNQNGLIRKIEVNLPYQKVIIRSSVLLNINKVENDDQEEQMSTTDPDEGIILDAADEIILDAENDDQAVEMNNNDIDSADQDKDEEVEVNYYALEIMKLLTKKLGSSNNLYPLTYTWEDKTLQLTYRLELVASQHSTFSIIINSGSTY